MMQGDHIPPPPANLARRIVGAVCDDPRLSNLVRNILEAGMASVRRHLRAELEAAPGETKPPAIADLACGTGEFAELAGQGRYVGVDLNARHIAYAQKKHGGDNREFIRADARQSGLPDKSFDVVLALSLLHHLPDADAAQLVREAKRLARDKIIFVDLAPLSAAPHNWFGRLMYALDQGDHIRPAARQVEIVGQHAAVRKHFTFRGGVNMHTFIVAGAEDGAKK